MFVLNNREPTSISRDLLLQVFFVVDVGVGGGRGDRDFSSSITGYSFTVLHQPNIEVVAYHWHPDSDEGSTETHVHFGPASARLDSAVRPGDLHKVHFPTGFVSIEKFIWLLIDEFKVQPRRSDWRDILSQ